MERYCKKCKQYRDLSLWYFRKNTQSYYYCCRVCKRENDREYTKKNKEKNRKRARNWYYDNKERAKERIYSWQKSDLGRQKIKQARDLHKINNSSYWRYKKKRDKTIRRCREYNSGTLNVSTIVVLENYNLSHFQASTLVCEFCKEEVGFGYHLEHLTPLSRGGKNNLENLAIACPACNLRKLVKSVDEYRPDLVSYFKERRII